MRTKSLSEHLAVQAKRKKIIFNVYKQQQKDLFMIWIRKARESWNKNGIFITGLSDRGDADDAVLGWEDKEINFDHVKPMACQLGWGVSETAEVGDEVEEERSGVERLICDLSINLLIYSV